MRDLLFSEEDLLFLWVIINNRTYAKSPDPILKDDGQNILESFSKIKDKLAISFTNETSSSLSKMKNSITAKYISKKGSPKRGSKFNANQILL